MITPQCEKHLCIYYIVKDKRSIFLHHHFYALKNKLCLPFSHSENKKILYWVYSNKKKNLAASKLKKKTGKKNVIDLVFIRLTV